LDTLHVYLLHHLLMMELRTVGCHSLKSVHGLKIHRTDVGGALITDAPTPAIPVEPASPVFTGSAALAFRKP